MTLLLVLVLGVAALGAWRLWEARRMQQLRDAPPERVALELRLPRGCTDAVEHDRMAMLAAAASLATGKRAWQQGVGQLDRCYIVRRAQGEHTPTARHVLVVDSTAASQLTTTMQNAYGSDLDITRLADDEGRVLAQAARATRFA
jgi:hypothetical protein